MVYAAQDLELSLTPRRGRGVHADGAREVAAETFEQHRVRTAHVEQPGTGADPRQRHVRALALQPAIERLHVLGALLRRMPSML